MKEIALLAVAACLAGCIVVAKDPNRAEDPPPAPPPAPAPEGAVEASLMLRYTAKVNLVYDAAVRAIAHWRFRVSSKDTPGDDNWWLVGVYGPDRVRIDFNRRDHKTRTWVRVTLHGRSPHDAQRLAEDIHRHLGSHLGEPGRN